MKIKKSFGVFKSGLKGLPLTVFQILCLAVVYHLAARLGLKLAYEQVNTSPVWPPTGIGLAALLLFGLKLWPGITAGVLIGSLVNGAPLLLSLGMALGNTLGSLICAYFLKKIIKFHNTIDRVQDVLGLTLFAVVSTSISATIGTSTLLLLNQTGGAGFGTIWLTWWVGDLLGALVIGPALLVWLTPAPQRMNIWAYLEGFLVLAFITVISWYVFSFRPSSGILHQSLFFLIFPVLIWAALRLGQRGATICIGSVSVIAILGTIRGVGPLTAGSLNDSLVLLQTFTGVLAFTSLILAASTIERRKTSKDLKQRVHDLAALNDSSSLFLRNFDVKSIFQIICELAVDKIGLDGVWIEIEAGERRAGPPPAVYGLDMDAVPELKHAWEQNMNCRERSDIMIRTADMLPEAAAISVGNFQLYASLPLAFDGEPIGFLKMLSREKYFFTGERLQLIQSYANLAAVAIKNTWLYEQVQHGSRQLQALSQRLFKAHEEERLHLSRELHDESGQLLAALAVQMGLLKKDAAGNETLGKKINTLIETSNELQEKLHELAVNLRPASLYHLGLMNALQQHAGVFSRQHNIQVEFEAVGMDDLRLPIEMETALFRVVQEAMTNISLHAQATRIDVLISRNDHLVAVILEDNGVGFHLQDVPAGNHLGLFGMRERIEMLGGTFTIEREIGKGTTVRAEGPCHD
ncbi:MAG: hypothetical protein E4H36_15400 [Spirochaetales bacterium]|nr:MAG: hypothetical protein E4H36_15400 [Spirochaetales bacterium]